MNFRLLAALCAVADVGSLTGAARKLGISAATISERITALEDELGTKLVLRSGRMMALTSPGNAVAAVAREILDQVGELKQIAHAGEVSGKLKLGSMSTALTALLPEALERIAAHYPMIELLVVPGTSDVLYAQVEARTIDCAVVVHPPFALNKSLRWNPIRDEPIVLVSHVGDTARTPRASLEKNRLIRIDRNDWTGKIITGYLADARITPSELFEMNALEAMLELVSKGLGVALMPDWGLPMHRYSDIRVQPLPEAGYSRKVGVISPTVSARAPLVKAITDILQDIEHERQAAKKPVQMPRAFG